MNLGLIFLPKLKGNRTRLLQMSAFISNKLIHPSTHAPHLFPRVSRTKEHIKTHSLISAIHPMAKTNRFIPDFITKVTENNAGLVGEEDSKTLSHLKTQLLQQLEGTNRGIFGVASSKKSDIEALVKLLESQNPTPDPSLNLEKVGGCWKLVYSSITILGSKRTKLGLRDFITLGEFYQTIDIQKRVEISYDNSTITPDQVSCKAFQALLDMKDGDEPGYKIVSRLFLVLMNVFRKNYDILLGIFNPEGWLEITYVDETMRIGRDDKGNLFILERSEEETM